jgi:predicted transcriptional regulator
MQSIAKPRLPSQPRQTSVVCIHTYRIARRSRRLKMLRMLKEKLSDPKSILSEGLGRDVLASLVVADELRIRHVQDKFSVSYSRAKRALDKLEAEKLVTHREIPHRNPGMPGTYVYSALDTLCEQSDAVIDLLNQAKVKVTPLPKTLAMGSVESILIHRLQKIRPSSRADHFNLVRLIARSGQLTMNDLASEIGLRPQNVHSRLQRLIGLKILSRSKEGAQEFCYHLAPDITRDAVEAFATSIETVTPPIQEVSAEMKSKSTSPRHEASSKGEGLDLATILAEKLPDFDPSWPLEVQQRWLASLERIAEMGADQKTDSN